MDLVVCYFKEIWWVFIVMLSYEIYFKQHVYIFHHTVTFIFSNFRSVHCFQ